MYEEEKSHVGMGHYECPVCHVEHDEVVLLDKRMRKTLLRNMMMGYALCPQHAKMRDEYVALVEMSGDPNDAGSGATFTGYTVHVRRTVAKRLFNVAIPDDTDWMAVEVGVIDALQKLQGEEA